MEALGLDEAALPRLVTLIPAAKRRLALNVHADPRRRESLRKSFSLTVSSGAASLSSHLAASEPLILDTVKAADIRSASSTYKWQWKGNRSLLAIHPTGTDFFAYTLEGTSVYTDASDSSATMIAGYEPSLSTVETLGLDDELVELVAAMAVPGREIAA
jgi:hypothetical protein